VQTDLKGLERTGTNPVSDGRIEEKFCPGGEFPESDFPIRWMHHTPRGLR